MAGGRRGGVGGGGGRGGVKKSGGSRSRPPLHPAKQAMQEAEEMQQKAERRKGKSAIPLFEQCAAKFRQALELGLNDVSDQLEAHFGLGEALQSWGDAVMEVSSTAPDAEQSAQFESEAKAQANLLYEQAVQMYAKVQEPSGHMRVDAAVNCGNTLLAASELAAEAPAKDGLLRQAVTAYETALQQEEDALTLGNLADAYVKLGEAACGRGQGEEGGTIFSRAMETFQQACGLCDSASGDDLSGLLHDWGVGLNTAASHAKDEAAAESLLLQALSKLKDASSFDRGDVQPLNAMGDVYVALFERRAAQAAAERSGLPDEAGAALLDKALEEGYRQALHIRQTNADAWVGTGEVLSLKAKLLREASNHAAAAQMSREAANAYASALQSPGELGAFSERCDTRYNYACALALSGQESRAAQELLTLQQARGPELLADLQADAEMQQFLSSEWFASLSQQQQQQ